VVVSDFGKIWHFEFIRGRMMKRRSATKSDLFAAQSRAPKIDSLSDSLVKTSWVVDFAALASRFNLVAR